MTEERWVTAEEVAAARQRMEKAIEGYEQPVAYSVARCDDDRFTWAHVNDIGGTHALPAVVLATVCGYASGNATAPFTGGEFAEAIRLLSPAEACDAFDHPNLWSWRPLLEASDPDATFVAVFVGDLAKPSSGEAEDALRSLLST